MDSNHLLAICGDHCISRDNFLAPSLLALVNEPTSDHLCQNGEKVSKTTVRYVLAVRFEM